MDGEKTTRRAFYQRMIYLLTSIVSAALALPAIAYFLFPPRNHGQSGWAEAGDVNDLPLNEPHEVIYQERRQDGWKISIERATAWVLRRDRDVIAFAPHCTHLGCGYHWEARKEHFVCPCHASTFSKEGDVLSGPAPRPLDRFETRVEGARLWVGGVVRSNRETEA